MFNFIKRWYYRRLFLRIYFKYLDRLENPSCALVRAVDDFNEIYESFNVKS